MQSELASIILGVILVIAGSIMLKLYFKRWVEEEDIKPEENEMSPQVVSQLKRRFQIAVIVLFLGFLIPVIENLITEKRPTLYVFSMTGVLLLAFWILFLGMVDILLVRTHTKGNLQELNARKKELERQIADIKKMQDYKNDPSSDIHDVNLN
jgi:hypothetical protein